MRKRQKTLMKVSRGREYSGSNSVEEAIVNL